MSTEDPFRSPEFHFEEITEHGRTAGRVRQLYDADAYVMLGRLASAVARLESAFQEATETWKQDREDWRRDRKELMRLQRQHSRRSTATVAGIIVAIQSALVALHQTGIIK